VKNMGKRMTVVGIVYVGIVIINLPGSPCLHSASSIAQEQERSLCRNISLSSSSLHLLLRLAACNSSHHHIPCGIFWSASVEQALFDKIERCGHYLGVEIEYQSSRFGSEITRPNSQSEACDKRANSKEITNESGPIGGHTG
jgi:hypothetical protein